MQEAIYEDRLKYGLAVKLFLGSIVVGVLLLKVWTVSRGEMIGEIIMFATLIFILIFLFVLLPRKFQVFDDRIKVIWGLLRVNIPFDDIKTIESRPDVISSKRFRGLCFRTSVRDGNRLVLIERKKGKNVLLKPSNRERFIEILENTMRKWRENTGR